MILEPLRSKLYNGSDGYVYLIKEKYSEWKLIYIR